MFLNTFKLFNEESIPTCTISVFVIMLQFTVHIENIHVASTISQDNQLQAWKLAEQQNRPCTSVSASGKSSGKLIMANRSQLKFPFERGTFKQVVEFIQVVKKKTQIRPHPVEMLQVPRSHQQQVKKRKLVFLQSSPDYCRCKNKISQQTVSNLIIIFTFMIIRMNVTAGYKGVVGRTCKTDPNRCLSICFEGLLQLLGLH